MVSSKAETCPNCGAAVKKKSSLLGNILKIFLIIIVVTSIVSIINTKDKIDKKRNSTSSEAVTSQKTQPIERSSSTTRKENTQAKKKPDIKTYNQGETVSVGYTSYNVHRSWWSNKLSTNQFLDKKPNASYLFVELTVRNDDKKARTIPPFHLVDSNDAEYNTASGANFSDNAIGLLETRNPSVQKSGVIVIDVPKKQGYKLKLDGGYWSAEKAYVRLNP